MSSPPLFLVCTPTLPIEGKNNYKLIPPVISIGDAAHFLSFAVLHVLRRIVIKFFDVLNCLWNMWKKKKNLMLVKMPWYCKVSCCLYSLPAEFISTCDNILHLVDICLKQVLSNQNYFYILVYWKRKNKNIYIALQFILEYPTFIRAIWKSVQCRNL